MIPLIQGHRGFPDLYPENTMLSFRKAIEAGAGAIEMDCRISSDGVHYVLHDSTLDRTTNGTGTYNQVTWDYIQTLDAGAWKGAQFANREDTKVPSLQEIFDEFQGSGVFFVLHLKAWINPAIELLNIVKSRGMLDECIFFGDIRVINAVKQEDPNAFTQNDGMPGENEYLDILAEIVANGHNAMSVGPSATQEMVDNIKSYGKQVHISSLGGNYNANVKRLLDLGVDYILGNDPAQMVQAYNEYYASDTHFRNTYTFRTTYDFRSTYNLI